MKSIDWYMQLGACTMSIGLVMCFLDNDSNEKIHLGCIKRMQ